MRSPPRAWESRVCGPAAGDLPGADPAGRSQHQSGDARDTSLPWVAQALEPSLPVPVVCNTGGYERVETLRLLEGKVQVYLPDMKYALEEPARRLSGAGDYPAAARSAICEMFRQTGPYQMRDGLLVRGC